jgi:putative membrane protein
MRTTIVVTVALAALACGKSQPPRTPTSTTTTTTATYDAEAARRSADSEPLPPAPQTMLEPSPYALETAQENRPFTELRSPDSSSLAKTEKPLSDAEVLGVALAANDGELQMAELATRKATRDDVKQFAALMKNHHGAALAKGKQLEARTKLTNAESDLSSYLKNDTTATLKDLREMEGKAFDRAYVDASVKAHRDALSAIDNRLSPSASNGEVKAMVTEMRRTVADHLTKAEELQKKVGASTKTEGRARTK